MLNLKNTLDGYLKNVEVIGNTVQDTNNLANIRSVGDKVEGQELYKIELACYGDNILRPDFELGLWNVSNGTAQADSTAIRTKGFLRIRNQAHLVKRFDGKLGCQVILFDGNFKYLGQQSYAGGNYVRYDNILPNAKYMKINFLNTTDLNLQCVLFDRVPSNINGVEFVEFQESKLEILSPVQLEKVGDVVDRIICKDGVWGVDKKVDAEVKNNVLVNTRTKSEFIPLPHDQQVKLRTFAGQTNIAFLTEIAGQIKAQVPKSLGATVNTHTEQIADLHNSLDRVKKLEETTVSTIETESNFTTVDATSNGYFEDVKLEGKTLTTVFTCSTNKQYAKWTEVDCVNYKTVEIGKVYTVIGELNNSVKCGLKNETQDYLLALDSSNGSYICKAITFSKTDKLKIVTDVEGSVNMKVIILEGDHTNNPPSYFEGLMSVGQDVEEVSVLSTENLADIATSGDNANFEIANLKAGHTYSMKLKRNDSSIAYNLMVVSKSDNFTVLERLVGNCLNDFNTFTPSFDGVLKFNGHTNPMTVSEIMLVSGVKTEATMPNYKPYAPNKKPLLYYNPTTETWEKPVLREWDTIEKHSDGKYYYHKRSGEVVFNGSETWNQPTWSKSEDWLSRNPNGFAYETYISITGKSCDTPVICNKFNSKSIPNSSSLSIGYCTLAGNYLSFATTVQSTVEQWKSELQTNNVTVVYQLKQEEVYECTNIDLMTYSGETNYIINSGAISPKSLLKVHNNISNVVKILQEKVSLLENTFIAGLKSVLSGDMYSLATILYPEDFEQNDNTEQDIMVIPE